MKIALTGASGLVGTALVTKLTTDGHQVIRLVRRGPAEREEHWNPVSGIEPNALQGVDAVVHLAGENIAEGRWTSEKKDRIRESRVRGTAAIARSLGAMNPPPPTLICASAIGYYGDRGDAELREDSEPGTGFLPDVCQAWEAAADPAREAGIRVVHVRFGVVLSGAGGALAKMLTPFKLGVGGRIGSGGQYMSWLSIDDATGIIQHALTTPDLAGPVNAVAPEPVTNTVFTKSLGRAVHRPTIFPMPAFVAKLAFGEMAEALLLASTRVLPERLEATGYEFRHRTIDDALGDLLEEKSLPPLDFARDKLRKAENTEG